MESRAEGDEHKRAARHLVVRVLLPMTMLVVGIGAWHVVTAGMEEHAAARSRVMAAVRTAAGVDRGQLRDPASWAAALAVTAGLERLWFVDDAGTIVLSSLDAESGAPLDARWRQRLQTTDSTTTIDRVPWGDHDVVLAAIADPVSGTWTVGLYDVSALQAAQGRRIGAFIVIGLLAWLLVALAMQRTLRQNVFAPLQGMRVLATKLAAGTRQRDATLRRIDVESGGLMHALVEAIRALADQRSVAQTEAAAARFRWEALTEQSNDLVLVASYSGVVLDAGAALCRRLGLARDAIRGRDLSMLAPHLPLDALVALAVAAREELCAYKDVELTFTNLQGEDFAVRCGVQALAGQTEAAYLVVAQDRGDVEGLARALAAAHDALALLDTPDAAAPGGTGSTEPDAEIPKPDDADAGEEDGGPREEAQAADAEREDADDVPVDEANKEETGPSKGRRSRKSKGGDNTKDA